ncbi:MAG TPA: MarR family transcriptional regulator [Allosphingosinicella sp.]|nr:MarR family transcriptional regulator [Allosphingosinicella sp.]
MRSVAALSDSLSTDAGPASDAAIMRHFLTKPGFLLARVDQICTALYGERGSGETLAQAEFLLLVDALGTPPQVALARAAGVDTSTTAYVLANLCARGLVARTEDAQDRRRAVVTLTAAGRTRLAPVAADYAALQDILLAPLEPEARERLRAMLGRIAAHPDGGAPAFLPSGSLLDSAPSFLSRRALQLFQAQFIASVRDLNLTPRQLSLLFILTQAPEITQVGFARLFGLDPSTCAVVMRNLARRGLLDSAPSAEDRRARTYRITAAGRRMAAEAGPRVDRSEGLVFRDESAADSRWLVKQLQQLVLAHSRRLRFPGALVSARPL